MELAFLDFNTWPLGANIAAIGTTMVVVALGAHWMVEAAARLAKRFGVSELVIGLTVVAAGTSAPEFAVTIIAAFQGQGDISVGNIVGSNIFNLGFILGGCAIVRAIPVDRMLLWRDGTILALTTVLLLGLIGFDLELDRLDGAILFGLLILYLGYLFVTRHAIPGTEGEVETLVRDGSSIFWNCFLLIVGLACILAGSHLLIGSSTAVARAFGISEWLIGVTIVAAGTSAPEFATSLVAVIRGKYGISAGNIIGSDLFNLLGVLGLAGLLHPVVIDPVSRISLVALAALVFVTLFFMRTGWRISRLEGLLLVIFSFLVFYLSAVGH